MNLDPCVFIVDDDEALCSRCRLIFESEGIRCQTFESAEQFLDAYDSRTPGCLLLDVCLPGLNGEQLQAELTRRKITLPIIFMSAYGDIPMTVRAIKAGAVDFLAKPVQDEALIDRVQTILQHEIQLAAEGKGKQDFINRIAKLTSRERELLPMVLAGTLNKEIAQQMSISHRTVERHRIRILKKTGTTNFLELAHLCETYKIELGNLL